MSTSLKPWTSWALGLAGVHNLSWAAAAALWPSDVQALLGVAPVSPLAVWDALLWVLALAGAALLLAAIDPAKNWVIVLISFVAKAGAFAGAIALVLNGSAPQRLLAVSVANDVAWLPVLGAVLYAIHESELCQRRTLSSELLGWALRVRSNNGVSLEELTHRSPVLVVFLRHAGCPFCREAMADLAAKRAQIEADGTRLVLVHMGSEEQAARQFERCGLGQVTRFSDPKRALYRAFGLRRGSLLTLFGPKVWVRGFQAAILRRHGIGPIAGDGFQMPGAFLLYYGEILRSYRHQNPSDRPDYLALSTGHCYAAEEFRE